MASRDAQVTEMCKIHRTKKGNISNTTYRVPDRFEVPESRGIPTKQASRPSALFGTGRRIIEAIPPERGMSFGLIGKLNSSLFNRLLTVILRDCNEGLFPIRWKGFEPNKRTMCLFIVLDKSSTEGRVGLELVIHLQCERRSAYMLYTC